MYQSSYVIVVNVQQLMLHVLIIVWHPCVYVITSHILLLVTIIKVIKVKHSLFIWIGGVGSYITDLGI